MSPTRRALLKAVAGISLAALPATTAPAASMAESAARFRTIDHCISWEWFSNGRPSGEIDYAEFSRWHINLWVYADGSARLLFFHDAREEAVTAIPFPAPYGWELKAALFDGSAGIPR